MWLPFQHSLPDFHAAYTICSLSWNRRNRATITLGGCPSGLQFTRPRCTRSISRPPRKSVFSSCGTVSRMKDTASEPSQPSGNPTKCRLFLLPLFWRSSNFLRRESISPQVARRFSSRVLLASSRKSMWDSALVNQAAMSASLVSTAPIAV